MAKQQLSKEEELQSEETQEVAELAAQEEAEGPTIEEVLDAVLETIDDLHARLSELEQFATWAAPRLSNLVEGQPRVPQAATIPRLPTLPKR